MGNKTSNIAGLLLTAVAALAFSVPAAAQTPAAPADGAAQEAQLDSLYFTAEGMGNLSVFFRAVKAAGLADTLKGAGPFTVFAPTDEAFAKLPAETLEELFQPQNKARLRDILINHVFAARATAAELGKLNDSVTLRRRPLAVDLANGPKVGGASVTRTDIMATNGVMHLIDTVLVPAND